MKNISRDNALITTPAMAANRLLPRVQPTMLTINAIGGARSIVSPPRTVRPDPQPGFRVIINTSAAGATNDSHRPSRPAPAGDVPSGVWVPPVVCIRLIRRRPSKRHVDGFADGLDGFQVELHIDADFFADQFLGHSP
jgi:hypothetical protein